MYVCISGMRRSIYRWMRTYLLFTTWDYQLPSGNFWQSNAALENPYKSPYFTKKCPHNGDFPSFSMSFLVAGSKKAQPPAAAGSDSFSSCDLDGNDKWPSGCSTTNVLSEAPTPPRKVSISEGFIHGLFCFICIFKYRLVSIFLGGDLGILKNPRL